MAGTSGKIDPLYWGKDQVRRFRLSAPEGGLTDAELLISLGLEYGLLPLQTIADGDITRETATDTEMVCSFTVLGEALATALESERTHYLKGQVDLMPVPIDLGVSTYQFSITVKPAY